MRTGSLFSGYGGLEMAVNEVFGATTAWVSDIDKGACKILAHRYPDVPNLGDITTVDWSQVEPIDILTAGYPCQPFSSAGYRQGEDDERHLWPFVLDAIRALRPRNTIVRRNERDTPSNTQASGTGVNGLGNSAGDPSGALRGWGHLLARPCPWPLRVGEFTGNAANPIFWEWLMGLPAGWVTEVPDLTHAEKIKALGNGVVPQQAAAALRTMLAWTDVAA